MDNWDYIARLGVKFSPELERLIREANMPDDEKKPSKGLERIPKRIRVVNETGAFSGTDIFDAETNERVLGVMAVRVTHKVLEIELTVHWPLSTIDYTAYDDDYKGSSRQGVKTVYLTFPIRKLFVESW